MVQAVMNSHRALEAAVRQLAEGGSIDDLSMIHDLLICVQTHKKVEFKDLGNL